MDIDTIREELWSLADAKYRQFNSSLMPGTDNVLGVRVPLLRKLAGEIARSDDWRTFVEESDLLFNEEPMLQGMVIAKAKMDWEERKHYMEMFVPRINNWAVCDVYCNDLKAVTTNREKDMWIFILPYLQAAPEFERRFGIVMLFYYINQKHIDFLFNYADTFDHPAYYTRMAIAWLLSACFVKFPEETMAYFKRSKLDKWTYRKAIQKTRESRRVDKATKEELKQLLRYRLRSR